MFYYLFLMQILSSMYNYYYYNNYLILDIIFTIFVVHYSIAFLSRVLRPWFSLQLRIADLQNVQWYDELRVPRRHSEINHLFIN